MSAIPPASGVTIHNGDTMDVSGGASVDSTWILTGGSQTVGGSSTTSTATNTNIEGGEQDVVFNGVASYATIYQGVLRVTGEYVHEGPLPPGEADHTSIEGGEQDVDTGIATTTTVNSGGVENVTNGGTSVESGGTLTVSNGALASGTTLQAFGRLNVEAAGTVDFVDTAISQLHASNFLIV